MSGEANEEKSSSYPGKTVALPNGHFSSMPYKLNTAHLVQASAQRVRIVGPSVRFFAAKHAPQLTQKLRARGLFLKRPLKKREVSD